MPSYSSEEKKKAVELYIKYDRRATQTLKEIGYPENRHTLIKWYKEYQEKGKFSDIRADECHIGKGYTQEQIQTAVNYYLEHGKNLNATIKAVGVPSRPGTLKIWINHFAPGELRDCSHLANDKRYDQDSLRNAVAEHMAYPEKPLSKVARENGVSRLSAYYWKEKLWKKDYPESMKDRNTENLPEEDIREELASLRAEAANLRKEVYRLQMEKDLLEVAASLIKKGKDISLETLTNREKAIAIDVLRNKYKVAELIPAIGIARSTYFAQKKAMRAADKYSLVRKKIKDIFDFGYRCYGYRRIYENLKVNGFRLSEKVVRRIMKEEKLIVPSYRKPKAFSSYVGEVSPAVDNLLGRDFHAPRPNMKWTTDISEFHIPAGKVYLSPVIDCFDGMPISWTIGTSPSAELANTMLDKAIATLSPWEKPIVHSDRGGHYRWPGWISRMESNGLIRSMSRKACSADNSACEGFFGRIKNEMFYGRNWKGWSLDDFMYHLDRYLNWFCRGRIKLGFNGMSPMERRLELGIQS